MEQQQAKGSFLMRLVLSVSFLSTTLAPLTMYGADGMLKGRVTDKTDGEGVVGASVVITGTNIGTATDINGNFVIKNVPAKQQKVSVSIVGYAPATQIVNVGDGQTANVNFTLGQTTIMASEVVVGAALYKQDRLSVPVTTNVVSKEQIRQEPNPSLDQVIENVPGVTINRSSGYSASALQIRGSNTFQGGGIGTRVNAFYDGFPINTPETGGVLWTNINMNAAERVEIVKGAASTLYGSGAMGGVVNVYGSLPDKFEVKAGVSGGFYDAPPSGDNSLYRKDYTPWFWNSYVGVGNKNGDVNYSLLYTHSDNDGYRKNSQTLLNDVKFKLRYNIDSKQYLQLTSFYSETTAGYVSTWPYVISFIPPSTIKYTPDLTRAYDLADPVYNDDTVTRTDALVGLNYVNLLSDKLSLDARVYYTRNQYRIDYNPTALGQNFPSTPGPLFGFVYHRASGAFNENKTDRYGAGVKLDWRVNDSHRLLFGVDGNIVDLASTQYAPVATAAGVFGNVQEKNAALFVQDEWTMADKLTALLSVRYDSSSVDASNVSYIDYSTMANLPKTEAILNKSVDAISPRIALNYKAEDDLSFRGSWGKSFRAPTLAERFVRDAGLFMGNPNPALDKETMTAYEVGMFKQFSDKVSLDVSAYLNDYDNLIESANISKTFARPVVFHYENIAKARIWGIETNLNIRPNDSWSFNVGYAYMNAINKSYKAGNATLDANPDPRWLTYRPEHTGSASATWNATKDLSLTTNARYVSKYKSVNTYTNPTGTNYPGGFIVTNAIAKYKVSQNVSVSLICNNIGNVQYEEAEWFRAPGRSYLAGIDLKY
ncbi:MAG: TonB-dependent receptor [Chlorobiaceae bacterium]|nr:TonB-dependent receptor [Chlorobiaceae bacterium]